MSDNKDTFVFYKDWVNVIQGLPDEIRLEVYDAIAEYGISGKLSDLKPMAKIAFGFIKQQMDRDREKYHKIKKIRSEAGKKGASKKWQTIASDSKNSKCHLNVNDNVNVNDNNVLLEKEPKGSLSDLEEEGKAKPNNDIDFEKLLNFISDKTKRKFKTINDQIKRKYKARLKEGYTKEDILEAIENAVKDKYHMEQGYKYLTPEFFSRPVTLDKYKNTTSQKATEKKKTYGIWSV
ncbi:conserved phage C-terminal domain-containing protein [Riemerella anatipestifer]|uniref:conserved phage C-terminal domain-containing protein n=1 Tax=Riemerella anatipestifer TaxID=34085 RepID=UPI0021F8F3E5|nr:conserved phage C-terminal domain-containing protein [Riemerella anatipestifer]MCW0518246.1 conserved phage C-terminal domain-containing protein [Riemerella anatipestifer]